MLLRFSSQVGQQRSGTQKNNRYADLPARRVKVCAHQEADQQHQAESGFCGPSRVELAGGSQRCYEDGATTEKDPDGEESQFNSQQRLRQGVAGAHPRKEGDILNCADHHPGQEGTASKNAKQQSSPRLE